MLILGHGFSWWYDEILSNPGRDCDKVILVGFVAKSTQDKATVQEYTEKLIEMTNGFCDSYLDEEYKALFEKLIRKMSRKRVVPFFVWEDRNLGRRGSLCLRRHQFPI
jgi:hypothetical protein